MLSFILIARKELIDLVKKSTSMLLLLFMLLSLLVSSSSINIFNFVLSYYSF